MHLWQDIANSERTGRTEGRRFVNCLETVTLRQPSHHSDVTEPPASPSDGNALVVEPRYSDTMGEHHSARVRAEHNRL